MLSVAAAGNRLATDGTTPVCAMITYAGGAAPNAPVQAIDAVSPSGGIISTLVTILKVAKIVYIAGKAILQCFGYASW